MYIDWLLLVVVGRNSGAILNQALDLILFLFE